MNSSKLQEHTANICIYSGLRGNSDHDVTEMLLTVTLDSYHEITCEGNRDKENKSTIHYRWKDESSFSKKERSDFL
jgi:predicted esterase